ncbi:MAG: GH25 family lysozyme [Massiliimalia sp.]|jgi:glucan-binding repeat-containing protein
MNELVLDVSYYQPVIQYETTAKSVFGAILRCGVTGWGTSHRIMEDTSFQTHYEGFTKAGLPIGAYYYSAADTVEFARKEAEFTIGLLKGKKFAFPIYYDIENEQRQGSLSRDALTEIALTYLNMLRDAGFYPGIYVSRCWAESKLHMSRIPYTVWIAQYGSQLTYRGPADMWQFTSQGSIPGISGDVDLNRCFKDFPTIIPASGTNGFPKSGWYKLDGIWYYRLPDGNNAVGWHQIDGKWYYFNPSGQMQTGWLHDEGKWYYLGDDGAMVFRWQKIDGYWYFFDPSGAMVTGWQTISGKRYYFNSSGQMQTGLLILNNKAYYLASSGELITNRNVTLRADANGILSVP